jgi:CRISPR-associated endonuclease/helicase Cas3
LDYYRCWGKSNISGGYHLLAYHSLDVAAVAWVLLEKSPGIRCFFEKTYGMSGLHLSQLLCFFIALHDLGKFSRSFQQLNADIAQQNGLSTPALFYDTRHDALGLQLWNAVIQNYVLQHNMLGIPAQILADASDLTEFLAPILNPIFGHHGKPVYANGLVLAHKFTVEDIQAATSFVTDLMNVMLPEVVPEWEISDIDLHLDHMKKMSWWLSGFVVFCDWIGSNRENLGFENKPMPLSNYWEIAKANAAKQLSQADFLSAGAKRNLSFQELFGAYTPTPLQKAVLDLSLASSPQLFILEDVTGAGKTEAALALAHRLVVSGAGEGVYFGLPTMATSTAMYERVSQVYQSFFDESALASLVLAHGANALVAPFLASLNQMVIDPQSAEETTPAFCNYWFADNRKKALLAPFGVGTIDQALLGILGAKYQSLRLWGLRGKILILDEVHASDAYMHGLTKTLLEFHAASGGSVILLSATLPQKMRQELLYAFQRGLGIKKKPKGLGLQYPLITHSSEDGFSEIHVATRKEVQRTLGLQRFESRDLLAAAILEKLTLGHCVAWVCNTVADAIETYALMQGYGVSDMMTLFHARFAMGDRLAIENSIKAQFGKESTSAVRRGKLVIATQVIEQSMDLDFDYMVSDLAPVDLLIQRAGRLRRHVRLADGDLALPTESDQRGQPVLWIYSPVPSRECTDGWYSDVFPRAAHVYEDHGKLWLTARWIEDHQELSLPEGLRDVIEYVFDEDGEGSSQIPEALHPQEGKALGKKRAAGTQAQWASLCLESGYMGGTWEEDIQATTRLGEETVLIRLAKWEEGRLSPWVADTTYAWPLSEVSLRRFWVSQEAPVTDKKLRQQMQKLKATWPGKSEYYIVVPMITIGDGVWVGHAIGQKKQPVTLRYSSVYGLQYCEN